MLHFPLKGHSSLFLLLQEELPTSLFSSFKFACHFFYCGSWLFSIYCWCMSNWFLKFFNIYIYICVCVCVCVCVPISIYLSIYLCLLKIFIKLHSCIQLLSLFFKEKSLLAMKISLRYPCFFTWFELRLLF